MSPRARELGLDGVRRIEGRWGIQDKGLVVTLAVDAPRPRRGLLAYFDMPPIKPGTRVIPLAGQTDYMLLSLDLSKQAEITKELLERGDAEALARARSFADRFRDRTGLSLQDEVLAKIGPRMAVISSKQTCRQHHVALVSPTDFRHRGRAQRPA